jgi:hypothetical protein
MTTQRENKIKDFIGVYDGYIPEEACDQAIELFKKYNEFNKVLSRFTSEGTTQDIKDDKQLFCTPDILTEEEGFSINSLKLLLVNFDIALRHYYVETNIKKYTEEDIITDYVKIQKTLPSQGYHVWHVEHGQGRENEKRVLVYTIYLNTVEEGGETEFLYQSQRVKPVKGRIVIWPASFPYVHRGNPPLSGEKYILTSWISYK